jgi:hypothetical protein
LLKLYADIRLDTKESGRGDFDKVRRLSFFAVLSAGAPTYHEAKARHMAAIIV